MASAKADPCVAARRVPASLVFLSKQLFFTVAAALHDLQNLALGIASSNLHHPQLQHLFRVGKTGNFAGQYASYITRLVGSCARQPFVPPTRSCGASPPARPLLSKQHKTSTLHTHTLTLVQHLDTPSPFQCILKDSSPSLQLPQPPLSKGSSRSPARHNTIAAALVERVWTANTHEHRLSLCTQTLARLRACPVPVYCQPRRSFTRNCALLTLPNSASKHDPYAPLHPTPYSTIPHRL